MQTETTPRSADQPYRLKGFDGHYRSLSAARIEAGIRQAEGYRRSIQILQGDRVVDLKRY